MVEARDALQVAITKLKREEQVAYNKKQEDTERLIGKQLTLLQTAFYTITDALVLEPIKAQLRTYPSNLR